MPLSFVVEVSIMSTPSSLRRGRSAEKSAKSNKKIAHVGKPERYCSKFVQLVLEEIGKNVLNEAAKNSVGEDWVRKMTKSILKKISEGSIAMYTTEDHDANKIQEKIVQLEKTIDSQFNRLKENPNNRTRISLQPIAPSERAYTSGQYEAQCQSIQDKVQRLSDEISSSRGEVASCLDSLEQNVDIVRSNVDHFVQRAQLINSNTQPNVPANTPTPSVATAASTATTRSQQQQLPSQPAANSVSTQSSHTSSKEQTTGKQKRTAASTANKQDPLHKMVDHLG